MQLVAAIIYYGFLLFRVCSVATFGSRSDWFWRLQIGLILILMRSFGCIPQNQKPATKFLMFLSPPKKHAKTRRALPYIESELRSWRQFKSEGFRLHTSVQPVEPQTRVKLGRNAFFLPDFQFRFNLTLLQPNDPLLNHKQLYLV